jgi:hypothetical protein
MTKGHRKCGALLLAPDVNAVRDTTLHEAHRSHPFNSKPVVHMHVVPGMHDGTTVGRYVCELKVNPTVEVFLTANATMLTKRPDDESGKKLIDPKP